MVCDLIKNSPDLARLRSEGYEIAVKSGYLVVTSIPYVTSEQKVRRGTLVSELNLANNTRTAAPSTHVIHFIGLHPCYPDGSEIKGLGRHGNANNKLAEGLVVDHSFSNKPEPTYANYYEKVTRYIQMISEPARAIDPDANAQTGRVVESQDPDSPLVYIDTNSSRAFITAVSEKLKGQRLAIAGLGGTGSFILDLLAKTPVKEIHLFDDDDFRLHNAYRSPGAPTREQLDRIPGKVEYLSEIYSRLHKGIIAHPEKLSSANVNLLQGFHCVFLSLDSGPEKKAIVEFLLAHNVPLIDVGMGIQVGQENLIGIVRTTTVTPNKRDHIANRMPMVDAANDDYAANIQIAELNMLNAVMAVIRWKKLCGFYADFRHEHHATYTIETNSFVSDETQP
jgi:molybdopterin/thiamine biosynthesis adenylyltransferase